MEGPDLQACAGYGLELELRPACRPIIDRQDGIESSNIIACCVSAFAVAAATATTTATTTIRRRWIERRRVSRRWFGILLAS